MANERLGGITPSPAERGIDPEGEVSAASPELGGGQVWTQPKFPHCTLYLVYVAGGGNRDWCRIQLPQHQGNIAMTDRDGGGPLYSTEQMTALLARLDYECMGAYADILKAEREATYFGAIDQACDTQRYRLQRDLNSILDDRDGFTFEAARAAVIARTSCEAP